jgi:hypothetical protein
MPVMVAIGDMADWLSNLDKGTQQAIVVTALFAAGLGPALWAVGSMATGVGALVTMYGVFQASTIAATIATKGLTVAIMTNPIGLAIVGVVSLAAVMLPLIMRTDDAKVSQAEYNKALAETPNVTKIADEELNNYIETLIKARDETKQINEVLKGNLTASDNLTDSVRAQTDAYRYLTDNQKDVLSSKLDLKLAEEDAAIATYMLEQETRNLASGAKIAYDEASKSVNDHKKNVSNLQKEYNDLKDTIDRALGIDKEIEVADRGIERADIRVARAKQDLADIRKEIEEAKSASPEDLADLDLRERTAVLDLADAEDRYAEALAEASEKREDKVDIEEKLNGQSVDSAQTRLDDIAAQLKTEQTDLENALKAQETAQIVHENLMSQIDVDALTLRSANWATYVKSVNDNPAYARTYHVDYDSNGNAIGGLPTLPTYVDIPTPSYAVFSADDLSSYTPPTDTIANTTIEPASYSALPTGSSMTTINPTVNVYAQTNASPGEIAMTASREVGRLSSGGFGI